MPDYKEMYLTMVRAAEKAINILIEAQRKCEDIYINASSPAAFLWGSTPFLLASKRNGVE